MAQDRNSRPSGGTERSSGRGDESGVNRESSSDRSSVSSKSDRSAQRENQSLRDNQQIADDNDQSGNVDSGSVRNRAAEMEPAEGSRESAGGISNRSLDEERDNQSRLPRRGESQEDESA